MSVFRKHGVEGEVTQQYECISKTWCGGRGYTAI